ncbi:hypothetical protein [Frankia sp. AgB32]|uniref:hypothetical protein n=1 Tax=Frankia sp. AgB32 TaxID=631119 RepID=UPI00200DA7BC|nr:hypothetical protein [Frankia sp. AgB32]MCK9893372.1 hypothetical protein [Frankia sp. AgB32]
MMIVYRYAGRAMVLSLPAPIWAGLVEAVQDRRLDGLGGEWLAWAPSGGRAQIADGYVLLAYKDQDHPDAWLPHSVWQQIVAVVRAHAIDCLPVIESVAREEAALPAPGVGP